MEYCNKEEVVLRTGVLIGDNSDKLLFGEDTRKIENVAKDYLDYQAEVRHLTPKTLNTLYDGVKQFYRSNRITLYGDTKDYVGSSSNIKSNVDMPYTYEEIHKILDKCDERKRVIIYLLCSTGMRRGAVPDLKVGDLKYIEEYGIYEITVYKGYPEEYKTYCSLECANAINSYLYYRRKYNEKITPDSYLVRKQFNREDPRHTGSDAVTISLPTDPPEKHKIGTNNIETIIYQLVCDGTRTNKVGWQGDRHKNMAAHAFRIRYILPVSSKEPEQVQEQDSVRYRI
jgi:integrase